MKSLNVVHLIGRLGSDPQVRVFDTGAVLANFNLATDESYKKDGREIKNVNWHRIVAWHQLAEIMEKYLRKGDKVYIEGSLKTRTYEQDGEKRQIVEIVAKNMIMLGTPNRNAETHAGDEFLNPGDNLPY